MTAGVTIQQARCLEAIKAHIAEHGISPSYAELGMALGLINKSNVHRLVQGLSERGFLTTGGPGRARTIRLIEGPTREAISSWSEAEFERVAADIRSIERERQIIRANLRADAIQAEGRA